MELGFLAVLFGRFWREVVCT